MPGMAWHLQTEERPHENHRREHPHHVAQGERGNRQSDAGSSRTSALQQVEAGAWALDLNVGPQKKPGHEILPWLVEVVQAVVDVPLCLDTTNLAAIEAACEIIKHQPIINSTSAEPERLEKVPLVAAEYNTQLIGLTMEAEGIPISAEARVNIALEKLLPRAEEVGMPVET